MDLVPNVFSDAAFPQWLRKFAIQRRHLVERGVRVVREPETNWVYAVW